MIITEYPNTSFIPVSAGRVIFPKALLMYSMMFAGSRATYTNPTTIIVMISTSVFLYLMVSISIFFAIFVFYIIAVLYYLQYVSLCDDSPFVSCPAILSRYFFSHRSLWFSAGLSPSPVLSGSPAD